MFNGHKDISARAYHCSSTLWISTYYTYGVIGHFHNSVIRNKEYYQKLLKGEKQNVLANMSTITSQESQRNWICIYSIAELNH